MFMYFFKKHINIFMFLSVWHANLIILLDILVKNDHDEEEEELELSIFKIHWI